MLEQAAIAALGVGEAVGLEVEVAGPRPGALGDRRVGAVAHDRLPAVHCVARAVEPHVAEARLIERGQPLRVRGVAAQEVLVGCGRFAEAPLVEALVGDVEHGAAHHGVVAVRAVAREQPLLGGDRQAVLALARVGPGQEPRGRSTQRVVREVADQGFERGPRVRVARHRSGCVGVDQDRIGPPRRVAGRHVLQQQMRSAGELAEVAGAVVRKLEQAERGLDQLLVLG